MEETSRETIGDNNDFHVDVSPPPDDDAFSNQAAEAAAAAVAVAAAAAEALDLDLANDISDYMTYVTSYRNDLPFAEPLNVPVDPISDLDPMIGGNE